MMATSEWALLRAQGSLIDPTQPQDSLVEALIAADFKTVLLSGQAISILHSPAVCAGLVPGIRASSNSPPASTLTDHDHLIHLVVAITLLQAFIQANFTGPTLPFSPVDLLPPSPSTSTGLTREAVNAAAIPLLTLQGEPAYHLATDPALLVLARRVFAELDGSGLATLSWWLLRLHLVHQSLLDEPVPISEAQFQQVQALLQTIEDRDARAMLNIEIGSYHHSLGQDKAANQAFLRAAGESGLEFELTGALGKNTKFQIEAHSQLVLLAESRHRDDDPNSSEPAIAGHAPSTNLPEDLPLNDDTLLEQTEFTKHSGPNGTRLSHLDPSAQPPLYPLDQTLLLSLCLSQHNNSPSSGLTASQMSPFLARVISHPRNWSIHTTALLLRSRLEAGRSRTIERSTLQLAALIDQMPTSDSTSVERLLWFHQIPLPSKWEMERELAKRYLTLGIVRSALEIFTRLEMWEDVVACFQRLEHEAEAEKVVQDLLEGRKVESDLLPVLTRATTSEARKTSLTSAREAKLWCLLGDLELSKQDHTPATARSIASEHYTKAWEVSKHTFSRAQRSLGALLVGEQKYAEAAECFTQSLKINPLFSRTWFSLGVCYTRLEKWEAARDAFKSGIGVDDEDGEMWNNLAAIYLRLDEGKEQNGDIVEEVSCNHIDVCV